MSFRDCMKRVGGFVAPAFIVCVAVGAIAHAASRGQDAANPATAQPLAQPSLPVVTVSEPQAASTARAGESAGNEFAAHQLLSGNERGITYPGHTIVRTQAQLEALLQRIYSGEAPPESPHVDFAQHTLVYYSLGTGQHGDERIYIRSGSLEQGVLHVQVEIAHSSGNCLSATSLIAPFAIAALPFPAHEVQRAEYHVSHKSYPCMM